MSSVPGLGFLSEFPYANVRRVPVPGLDVALSVTAYQIAEVTRAVTTAVKQGQLATTKVAKAVEKQLLEKWEAGEKPITDEASTAQETTKVPIYSPKTTPLDVKRLTHLALLGVVRALKHAGMESNDALRGAGYGVVKGTGDAGGDMGESAVKAVETATEAAKQVGISEEDAAAQVAEGALGAAKVLGPEAVAEVREHLSGETPEDEDSRKTK
ncbi:MAG: hypothetical protein ACOC6S_00800 [Chloroflexota bacterium]